MDNCTVAIVKDQMTTMPYPSAKWLNRAMLSHRFRMWWQIFFAYNAIQNPCKTVAMFIRLPKAKKIF
jgi:hypothetical protein